MFTFFEQSPPHPPARALVADDPISDSGWRYGTHFVSSPSATHIQPTSIIESMVHGFGRPAGGVSFMNRRLWLVGCCGGLVVAGAVVIGVTSNPVPPQGSNSPPPLPVLVERSKLPRALFERNEHRGQLVQIGFELPLVATADPLVWEYRPGVPFEHTPPTYRIHFDSAPSFPPKLPLVLTGVVDRFEPDARVRPSRVPGYVVLTSAAVARASP